MRAWISCDSVACSAPPACESAGARATSRAHAGVSDVTVSRLERGGAGAMALDTLTRIGAALEIRLDVIGRWRGGELDRLIGSGHSALHETVARALADTGWLFAPETSFAIYGERGVIDILAYHDRTRTLLVIDLKTELVDVQALLGTVDRYRRLAPQIARSRGWEATTVGAWVILRDTPTNRRRLAAHVTVLRHAFPDDGRTMRRWLRQPDGPVSALSFLSDRRVRTLSVRSAGVRRVRAPGSSVGRGT